MKRRDFLKTGALLGTGLILPWESMALFNSALEKMSDTEKERILTKYFTKIFNSSIDPNLQLPRNRYHFAESFEIVWNKEKNTVFDFADEIIKIGSEMNLDWSMLRNGKLPENLSPSTGKLKLQTEDGGMMIIKFKKLKTHDAILRLNNHYQVLSYVAPNEWNSVKKLQKVENGKFTIYEGRLKGDLFKIWKNNQEERYLTIEEFKPLLKFKGRTPINFQKLLVFQNLVNTENGNILSL